MGKLEGEVLEPMELHHEKQKLKRNDSENDASTFGLTVVVKVIVYTDFCDFLVSVLSL